MNRERAALSRLGPTARDSIMAASVSLIDDPQHLASFIDVGPSKRRQFGDSQARAGQGDNDVAQPFQLAIFSAEAYDRRNLGRLVTTTCLYRSAFATVVELEPIRASGFLR